MPFGSSTVTLGTFKITLKDRDYISQAIIALQNNIITTDMPKIATTRTYVSDSNIYIEIVSNKRRKLEPEKIYIIRKNIQHIIKYEISNFSFIERKYLVDQIVDIETISPKRNIIEKKHICERIYNYIFK